MKTTLLITQIIDEWLLNIDVSVTTRRSYKAKINIWFRWLSKQGVEVRTPQKQHIIEYKQQLEQRRLSTLTIDGYVTVVKLFYKYLDSVDYYHNIGLGIRSTSRYFGHRKLALTTEQASDLMTSFNPNILKDVRDQAMIALMLYNGLRTCEVERMNVDDIKYLNGTHTIVIQRKGRRDKAEYIAISSGVNDLLNHYICAVGLAFNEPLFYPMIGKSFKRIKRETIGKIVKERLEKIGIADPRITAHSLRHTCASMLIAEGVNLEMIRDILGHTNTNTTRIYAAVAQQEQLLKLNPASLVEKRIKDAKNLSKRK